MRKIDILHMCAQNLSRRKSRTFLTVLGVFIGCCAIVIMVSLGFGTQEAQDKMLAQMGDLTKIEVYSYNAENPLTEEALNSFRQIEGVEAATAKLDFNAHYSAQLYAGANDRYMTYWTTIMGVDLDSAEALGYELLSGAMPEAADEVLVGEYFAYSFYDTYRPDGSNYVDRYSGGWDDEGNPINVPEPFFDPENTTISLEVYLTDDTTMTIDLKPTGVLKENYNTGYETSEGIVMSDSAMRSLIERVAVKKGEKKTEITYNNAIVKAVDIDSVAEVQSEIDTYGYETWSMESVREPLQEEAQQKQLMLGGLGAISLFVAAIGIANTMVMSISERTREIGVMKALGCYVGDIRLLFLSEAGAIGLIGGLLGSLVSFLVMIIINLIALGGVVTWDNIVLCILGGDAITRTSVIPLWLIGFAIVFSIFIGLAAGFAPANKAVKISALEAIKSSE